MRGIWAFRYKNNAIILLNSMIKFGQEQWGPGTCSKTPLYDRFMRILIEGYAMYKQLNLSSA